ncbi:MAG: hypothetical protein GWM92_17735, partial [Gemmatimonadetes bacterium]|nr:MmgE/PrpD family protein [Gemmatimonadota bacterium]NIR80626.1 MmgE/PrpD family protein [Gemmatimonadota bacterium]NIT89413.1 MmgE/PrpD family protein [Gemmatimonadota bacterium]NIU33217.1 MmgE/PrpD family protein [Gemmatimonadota bacterium]NIU37539.1 hypothetical protein [Gemmatimonadota bacterium]
ERYGGEIRVRTPDGEVHTARVDAARGDPEAPLGEEELDRKLRSLLAFGGMDEEEGAELLRRCRALADGGALFELL